MASSDTRLNLLPLHRLASGLTKFYSLSRPQKDTFIHYDSQACEEDQPDIVKAVSDILAGTPAGWKENEALSGHIEKIVGAYHESRHKSKDQDSSPRLPSKISSSSSAEVFLDISESMRQADSSAEAKPYGVEMQGNRQAYENESSAEDEPARKDWSAGAEKHEKGLCKPCGWHRKPSGCSKGSSCEFCHICDSDALKRKKKARLQRIKEVRRAAKAQQSGSAA